MKALNSTYESSFIEVLLAIILVLMSLQVQDNQKQDVLEDIVEQPQQSNRDEGLRGAKLIIHKGGELLFIKDGVQTKTTLNNLQNIAGKEMLAMINVEPVATTSYREIDLVLEILTRINADYRLVALN